MSLGNLQNLNLVKSMVSDELVKFETLEIQGQHGHLNHMLWEQNFALTSFNWLVKMLSLILC